jgi:hypothetical protein
MAMDGFSPQDEAPTQHLSAHCAYTSGKESFRVQARGMTESMDAATLTRSTAVAAATDEARRYIAAAERAQRRTATTTVSAVSFIASRGAAPRAREHRSRRVTRTAVTSSSGDDAGPGEGIGAARRDALRRRAATIEGRLRLDKTLVPAVVFTEATKGFTKAEKAIVLFWLPAPIRSAVLATEAQR